MSDSLEPPAKRARLEADVPIYGASATALDAPGSPVDDLDDDFYDTTPVKPSALPAVDASSSLFAAAATAPASFHLPGLGSVSETPAAQSTLQHGANTDAQGDGASEDGELSDEEAFYNDASAFEAPAANQKPGQVEAPQHDVAAVDTPSADTDGELDAALTAAIDEQNDAIDDAETSGPGFDSKAEFLRAAEANKGDHNAEWQLDSDASDSDSSSDSSSSDDSSDEEGSDEGELLDPEEQVRLLMAENADEPGATKAKVKTLNEQEEQYEKPDITVNADTKITELGKVESTVEQLVVIKANISGDYQVLESGSALCLQNRTVIGKVSEQIGRVEEPRYSVGFNDPAEIASLGIEKDTAVYYVNEHSTFVETEPLRRQKHTDASNLHDEETNEVEFSDDEKEAEYKREQKAKKRARAEGNDDLPNVPIPTGPRGHVDAPIRYQSMEYQGGGLKYSDDEDDDMGMYKPLARPDHFEQIVGHGAPLEDRSHVRRGMGRGRGPWGDRGRGFRGRGGFGGRGDFGAGRGDRGGYGGGRGDFGGGRGDRGGHRGDRGGHGNNRGDKGGDRGGRGNKNQTDRGRHQDQLHERQHEQQRNGPQHGSRSATSASPARQQHDRGQSQPQQDRGQSQMQQSPAGGGSGKNKNRKQRQREKRERERQQQQQQQQQKQQASPAPSGPSNANAYANNSGANWPVPFSGPSQPAQAYAPAPPPPPPAAATSYANPATYGQQQPAAGQPQQQQANWAAWAQWFQVVGAMSQQQPPQPQAPAPAPAPPPPQPQQQVQYPYAYQQYAQQAAPPNTQQQQQPNAQAGTASLQDILRALGGGRATQ